MLRLNVLDVEQMLTHITVNVSYLPGEESFRMPGFESDMQDDDAALYCVFGPKTDDCFQMTKAVGPAFCREGEKYWSFSFLKKYYCHTLQSYFRSLGLIATSNFIDDVEVWLPDKPVYKDCLSYRSFNIRVQFNKEEQSMELLIAMGDVKSVFIQALSDAAFSEMQETQFKRVLYKNCVYRYEFLPDYARRHLNEVYPCVSFDLLRELNIARPANEKGNRYLKYSEAIEQFRTQYLYGSDLLKIIRPAEVWKHQKPQCLDMSNSLYLQFGGGKHTDPMRGMREFGPSELIKDETVFFFIYHEADKALAVTINDYLAGRQPDFNGGLSGFLRMKYNTEPNMSISFKDKNRPLPEIKEKLDARHFDKAKNYVALYLSPHSKWVNNVQIKTIYYQLKELLLSYGVVSQTIDANKTWGNERAVNTEGPLPKAIIKQGFALSLPNILVAVHAKLGASPWCFGKKEAEELVIGISAYRSRDLNSRYVGSAFSFTNEGRFQGFNCFRSYQLTELAGSIALAVKNFCLAKKELQRLVIHFYKRLSKKELIPIEKMLSQLGLNIPVVVVSVNKSFSADLLGFDDAKTHKMPASGTFMAIENGKYLLYNNQMDSTHKETSVKSYPFPLKISIQKFEVNSSIAVPVSTDEEQELLLQVCRFSQLYWKSVSRQWLPVTLRYPEMLAQIAPHFRYSDIPEAGRDKLWFL